MDAYSGGLGEQKNDACHVRVKIRHSQSSSGNSVEWSGIIGGHEIIGNCLVCPVPCVCKKFLNLSFMKMKKDFNKIITKLEFTF
jgi:hypothetical protein